MRILIVDDHTLFRAALALLLKQFDPTTVTISVGSAEEALGAISHYSDLDLILLDLKLPGMDGLSVLPQLREKSPKVPVAILSASEDHETAHTALAAGAAGFIQKSASCQELQSALRLVLDGEVYLSPTLLALPEFAINTVRSVDTIKESGLTRRQLEVLELMSLGLPNKLIARRLELTEGTVKLHVSAVLRALETRNRTEAVREGGRRGLLRAQVSTI